MQNFPYCSVILQEMYSRDSDEENVLQRVHTIDLTVLAWWKHNNVHHAHRRYEPTHCHKEKQADTHSRKIKDNATHLGKPMAWNYHNTKKQKEIVSFIRNLIIICPKISKHKQSPQRPNLSDSMTVYWFIVFNISNIICNQNCWALHMLTNRTQKGDIPSKILNR